MDTLESRGKQMIYWGLNEKRNTIDDPYLFTIKKGTSIFIDGQFDPGDHTTCEEEGCFENEIVDNHTRYPLECVLQEDILIGDHCEALKVRPINLEETNIKNEQNWAETMKKHINDAHNPKEEKNRRLKEIDRQISTLEENLSRLKQQKTNLMKPVKVNKKVSK